MAEPTVAARLLKKYIFMSGNEADAALLRAATPKGWELVHTSSLAPLGEFQDVLLHRFMLLDLDEDALFDPLDVVRELRMELMLNIAIFCFGGSKDQRDEARLNRADRFFERTELVEKMLLYCHQYRWGD